MFFMCATHLQISRHFKKNLKEAHAFLNASTSESQQRSELQRHLNIALHDYA